MRVKKAGGGVWFVARKRRVGQRNCRRSVVCGEKTSRGSRRPAVECGLWRENAERVKGHVGGVWSRRANLPSGSKDLSVECGLGGEFAERVKKAVGGVWSRRANLPSGSRRLSVECGLWRENAAQVKGPKRPHSKRKRPAKSAPQTRRGASYQIINRTMTFHVLYGRRSFVQSRQKHKLSYRYRRQLPSLRR